MPIVRVDNYTDAYRLRAHAADVRELAARPDKNALTEFVNRQILELIQPEPDDFLVDVGCGDAALLRMIGTRAGKSIGIVSTVDEQHRLMTDFPELCIKAADAGALPLESACANKIVCNAVLFYLPSEESIAVALREMARIARPAATIFVGEIPQIDEYKHYGMYRGSSMFGFLWHLLTRNGVRSFLGMIRLGFKAIFGKNQIVLNSAGMLHLRPEEMIRLAERCGLKLRTYCRHKELDQQGRVVDSEFRYDYIFTV